MAYRSVSSLLFVAPYQLVDDAYDRLALCPMTSMMPKPIYLHSEAADLVEHAYNNRDKLILLNSHAEVESEGQKAPVSLCIGGRMYKYKIECDKDQNGRWVVYCPFLKGDRVTIEKGSATERYLEEMLEISTDWNKEWRSERTGPDHEAFWSTSDELLAELIERREKDSHTAHIS